MTKTISGMSSPSTLWCGRTSGAIHLRSRPGSRSHSGTTRCANPASSARGAKGPTGRGARSPPRWPPREHLPDSPVWSPQLALSHLLPVGAQPARDGARDQEGRGREGEGRDLQQRRGGPDAPQDVVRSHEQGSCARCRHRSGGGTDYFTAATVFPALKPAFAAEFRCWVSI